MPLLLITRLFDLELVAGSEWIWGVVYLILALVSAAIVYHGNLRHNLDQDT